MAYTTINKSSEHFNTKLYNGTGANQSITGVGFQPDFTWIKIRTTGFNHRLQDSVRGATKSLYTNLTNAEQTNTDGVLSFDTDGFSLGDDATNGSFNRSGDTFVSWNWLGGGTASSNTDGSITSTVSANTTSGFSIVSYTGTGSNATVGHSLGSTPSMIIVKDRDGARNWTVYHKSIGATKWLQLDDTSASQTGSPMWQDTEPTSSVFSIGTYAQINTSSSKYIAYCFAEKKGFSKFGSYTGNDNADGPFIYTGFKPAFTILKRTDSADNWLMQDNKRKNPFNVVDTQLFPDLDNAESSSSAILDYCSNGFKIRKTGGNINASGGSYIYMAFAEAPLVGTNNVPCTAR